MEILSLHVSMPALRSTRQNQLSTREVARHSPFLPPPHREAMLHRHRQHDSTAQPPAKPVPSSQSPWKSI